MEATKETMSVSPGFSTPGKRVTRSQSSPLDMGAELSKEQPLSLRSPTILPPLPEKTLKSVVRTETQNDSLIQVDVGEEAAEVPKNPKRDDHSNGKQKLVKTREQIEKMIENLRFFEEEAALLHTKQQQQNKEKDAILDMKAFKQVSDAQKLDLIMIAINKMNIAMESQLNTVKVALSHTDEGVFKRLRALEQEQEKLDSHIVEIAQSNVDLKSQNESLNDELSQARGIIQVMDRKMIALQSQVTSLQARSMSKNIIISGITEEQSSEEDCKKKA